MKQKQRGESNGVDGEHDLIDQLHLSTGMKETGGEGCVPAVVDGRVSQGTSVIDPGPDSGCSPALGDGRLHKLEESRSREGATAQQPGVTQNSSPLQWWTAEHRPEREFS